MSNEYLNNRYLEGIIARFQKSKREKAEYESIMLSLGRDTEMRTLTPSGNLCNLIECSAEYDQMQAEYVELQGLLAAAFFTLADNLARYAKFSYIDIDDAVQEGVMICFEKIDRFNPEIGKAFNYMTTVVINGLRQSYRTAKNYNDLKRKYHDYLESQVEQAVHTQMKGKKLVKPKFYDQLN